MSMAKKEKKRKVRNTDSSEAFFSLGRKNSNDTIHGSSKIK